MNREELMRPAIMIYDPNVPKEDAVIIDLNETKELSIQKSIRPSKLPQAVFEYLSPRERISYFFNLQEGDSKNK